MITKERLKEIEKQNGILYTTQLHYDPIVFKVLKVEKIDEHYEIDSEVSEDWEWISKGFRCIQAFKNLDSLYETKEQAEWARGFQRIERTEYLNLPNWKEFIKRYTYEDDRFEVEESFSFMGADGIEYYLCSPVKRKIYVQDINGYKEYAYEFSKEGCIKACEMAKRLFLGKEE